MINMMKSPLVCSPFELDNPWGSLDLGFCCKGRILYTFLHLGCSIFFALFFLHCISLRYLTFSPGFCVSCRVNGLHLQQLELFLLFTSNAEVNERHESLNPINASLFL